MTSRWIDYHSEALHDRAYALLMADVNMTEPEAAEDCEEDGDGAENPD